MEAYPPAIDHHSDLPLPPPSIVLHWKRGASVHRLKPTSRPEDEFMIANASVLGLAPAGEARSTALCRDESDFSLIDGDFARYACTSH
ncbi:hypothetical protein TSUD_93320 [Trifolium subterraneum]|uniref:Uncharacterized protein n=1 Tax=Trifolium subterraneum TaxID=3900 RepID=A0A2Z6LT34_TRISU|nr:hypothetical protein TSUD_93320 [Trifolium subterraneum]